MCCHRLTSEVAAADGVRAPKVALPFRRVALAGGESVRRMVSDFCGPQPAVTPVEVNLSATPAPATGPQNATVVEKALPPVDQEGGLCAQVWSGGQRARAGIRQAAL